MYVRLDQIIKLINEAGEHSIKDFESQMDIVLQERLDAGDNINIRQYKALKKENVKNLRIFLEAITYVFEGLEGEE